MNPMTRKRCRLDPLALEAWHDHELPPAKALRVRDHIETCAACRESVERLARTSALLAAQPRRAPGPDFAFVVVSRLPDRAWLPFSWRLLPQMASTAAPAALVVLLILLGVGIFKWLPVPHLLPAGPAAYAEGATPVNDLVVVAAP